jgi:hypothetical protein
MGRRATFPWPRARLVPGLAGLAAILLILAVRVAF